MKNTRMEIRFFTISEWEKEQDYLRRRHQEGWKLARAQMPCFYHFERCEPEDVVYQLDYNPDGLEHKEEYIQMFRDCGWEYIQESMGYSYFRKPASQMDGDEQIFCDESSRQDMMRRVFKGRICPLLLIFLLVLLPSVILNIHRLFGDGDSGDAAVVIILIAVMLIYIIVFLTFALRYLRYR